MKLPSGLSFSRAAPVLDPVLVLGAAAFHPILVGDSAAQLRHISETHFWRLIHWSIAFGLVLSVASVASISELCAENASAMLARAAVSVSGFGYAVSVIAVLFMLGGAEALARVAADPTSGRGAEAILLYGVLHPFALATLKVGAFAVSLGTAMLGHAVLVAATSRPWVGAVGRVAGILGVVIALILPAHSPAIVAGIGLAALWHLFCGMALVFAPGEPGQSRGTPHQGHP
jgi:hypothetical protein